MTCPRARGFRPLDLPIFHHIPTGKLFELLKVDNDVYMKPSFAYDAMRYFKNWQYPVNKPSWRTQRNL